MDEIIQLAGNEWTVKPFVLGEQKIIVPLIYAAQKEVNENGVTQKYCATVFELVAYTIARTSGPVTKDALQKAQATVEALPVSLLELSPVLNLIARAAGMGKPTGEAQGEQNPQTSTS